MPDDPMTTPAGEVTDLPLPDAVDLMSAWVSRAADDRGIRTLLIKGTSLWYLGLRPEQNSLDVDLLVEPSKLDSLDRALRQDGWVRREERFSGQWDAPHSRTFVHPEWPCDIDVHWFFPGFLADRALVFNELWDRQTRMTLAHSVCPIPDVASSALVLLLNRVRSGDPSVPTEIEVWARSLSVEDRDEVRALIARTGCEATLAPQLVALDLTPPADQVEHGEASRRRDRAATGEHGYAFFRLSHAGAGPLVKLRALGILIAHGGVGRGRGGGAGAQARRMARGARRAVRREA